MPYFKVLMKTGHWGTGSDRVNDFYVRAQTIVDAVEYAQKLPTVKHTTLPTKAIEISEDEFVINNAVYFSIRHYDNRVVPLTLEDFNKYVAKNIAIERKQNPNYKPGYLTRLYIEKFEECYNEEDKISRNQKLKVFNEMIVSFYNKKDQILHALEIAPAKPTTVGAFVGSTHQEK